MGWWTIAAIMSAPRPAATRPSTPDVRGLRVPDRTVELLRELILAHTGIHFDDGRLDVLRDKIAPLAIERGFDSLLDYYYLLKYDAQAPEEWARVFDTLSVQETYFWREADQFRALTMAIMPQLVERRRSPVRIWSIPCATGEEPLSIAIALQEAGWFDRASIEIHASDASAAALERAQQRRYGRRSFRQLPDDLRERYFTRTGEKEEWTVRADIFARVSSWTRVNLIEPGEARMLAGSDVIFCRNLFIYFTPAGVRDAAARFAQSMPSPGFLCVGAAESLLRTGAGFELQDLGGAYVYVKP
jgi:chemotaxis protein methyltransferase CheR